MVSEARIECHACYTVGVPRLCVALLLFSACAPGAELGDDCNNGRDDDGDTLVDCADPTCILEDVCSACGDDVLNSNEACDDGNRLDGDGCSSRCLIDLCGNGDLDGAEECDDGNLVPADGCSIRCLIDRCGNRVLDTAVEQCEDGNRLDGDGCSATCDSEAPETCGDGEIAFDPETFAQLEQCDDGDRRGDDGCSSTCTFEFCGDGVTQKALGEQCDDADPFRPAACQFCRIPECGDGFISQGEQCDDGNGNDGDGCSVQCRQEFCGDGIRQPNLGEQCDDGNFNAGDGCNFCAIE